MMVRAMTEPAWLKAALKDVGYREKPGNDNKYGRALGLNKVPWCDLAVTRWCQISGHPLPSMQPGMKTGAASVWYSMRFAQQHGLWHPSWEAKPGWQIVYGWQGPGSPPAEMHTGLIVSSGPNGSTGHTVEGNRGDQVGRFTFTVGSSVVLGAIDLPGLLLGRQRIHVTPPKPDPQPRNPHHPKHTGPSPKSKANTDPLPADLQKLPERLAVVLAETLKQQNFQVDVKKETATVKAFIKYAKAHTAFVGAVGTWLSVALRDGRITGTEWYGLIVAIATAAGVAAVPNRKKRQPKTS